jgi:hypothetical protein
VYGWRHILLLQTAIKGNRFAHRFDPVATIRALLQVDAQLLADFGIDILRQLITDLVKKFIAIHIHLIESI